jgi:beta-lactamase class C
MPDLATITDALISLPLQFEPGRQLLYSNAGYALLGRIVERVAGHDIWAEAAERLWEPLGLMGIVARPGPAFAERLAVVADARHAGTDHEAYNSAYWRAMAIPWGGLFGTVRDLARWAGSFLGGPSPLSAASRRLMTTDQARGASGGVASMKTTWSPAHWGLGWEVKGGKLRHWTGDLTSPATFCHFGATGTLLWADPEHELALAVFGNRSVVHLWPFVPTARWARLSNAVVAAVDR